MFWLVGCCVAWLALSAAAEAAPPRERGGEASRQAGVPAGISAGEAAARAQQATGGQVVKVERRGEYYQVRVLLPNGRVRQVTVDARSGRVRE
mgnify:CR=1 FL=1